MSSLDTSKLVPGDILYPAHGEKVQCLKILRLWDQSQQPEKECYTGLEFVRGRPGRYGPIWLPLLIAYEEHSIDENGEPNIKKKREGYCPGTWNFRHVKGDIYRAGNPYWEGHPLYWKLYTGPTGPQGELF